MTGILLVRSLIPSRKGKTYCLHAAARKSGKIAYVMKQSAQGALTELPEGYSIAEGVNGEVSVGRLRPGQITDQEGAHVAAALERFGLRHYQCAIKGEYIMVYEPLYSEARCVCPRSTWRGQHDKILR